MMGRPVSGYGRRHSVWRNLTAIRAVQAGSMLVDGSVARLTMYERRIMIQTSCDQQLIAHAVFGNPAAREELFDRHRGRLRKMVELRLDRRLQSRLDPSDLIQDVYKKMARSIAHYREQSEVPFYFWLRALACEKLLSVHRRHLRTRSRTPAAEVSLHREALPQVSSATLAQQLLGAASSNRPAQLAEIQAKLQDALNKLDPIDREIIVLRYFEEMTEAEVGQLLGIQKAAATRRYVRAVRRLRDALAGFRGFFEE
jgi:RNA polymerase sigma-70 factor (ECF subfamily)